MSRISAVLALACLSLGVVAQIPATASAVDIQLVTQQYDNSGLASKSNTGFGVDLKATAVLTIEYGFGAVVNGQAYTVGQVADAPNVFVTPTSASASSFTSTSTYTLTLADAASLGDPDTAGNYRHFLVNGLTGAPAAGANLTFEPTGGVAVTSYASPGPIAGTGPHRYAWLLFAQPSTFSAPSNLSTPGTAPSHWNVSSYVSTSGLGNLIAASFFTVENGSPTGSVAPTSAVNTATLASASSGASSRASSSGTKSGSASSSAASASQTQNSSASVVSAGTSLLVVGGLAALFL